MPNDVACLVEHFDRAPRSEMPSPEIPEGKIRAPVTVATVLLAPDNFAEAASKEYGGGLVVAADMATEPAHANT